MMSLKVEKTKFKDEGGRVRYVDVVEDEAQFFEARNRIKESFEDSDLQEIISKVDSPSELMIAQKLGNKLAQERSKKSIPSSPSSPPQGSIVSLEGNRGSSKQWVYPDAITAVNDLREKSEQARLKGDRASAEEKRAKILYDKLWALGMKQVHDQIDSGGRFEAFEMIGCSACGKPYDLRKHGDICPVCAHDQYDIRTAGIF